MKKIKISYDKNGDDDNSNSHKSLISMPPIAFLAGGVKGYADGANYDFENSIDNALCFAPTICSAMCALPIGLLVGGALGAKVLSDLPESGLGKIIAGASGGVGGALGGAVVFTALYSGITLASGAMGYGAGWVTSKAVNYIF